MKIYHVDAFTDKMFSGNPAAVCILPLPKDETWMQDVAGEMNLSETADPVTGSAHCCLGPYWKRRLNKNELTAFQVSERGGFLKVRVEKDRVFISGKVVTVFCAELREH